MSSDTVKKNIEKSKTESETKSTTESKSSDGNASSTKTSDNNASSTKSSNDNSSSTNSSNDNSSSTNSSNKNPAQARPTSYFSSVSSDEYREGWDSIFGTKNTRNHKSASASSDGNKKVKLPYSVRLSNEDLNRDLHDLLKDALRKRAKKDKLRIGRLLNSARITWHLECEISE